MSAVSRPQISVVIPCYNAAAFIARTLDSILAQEYESLEIVLVDDGSTDGTVAALAPYRDRIRYFGIPNSGGPSRPRNVGLQHATGELIAFFDADDLMRPGKLDAAAQAFLDHPGIDFLFTNFARCDENDVTTVTDYLADYQEFRTRLAPVAGTRLGLLSGRDTYRSLLRANFIGTSSVVCRASVFAAIGGFDETMPNSEDLDLWRRIARAGHTFAYLDEVGHAYRLRAGSVSRGGSRMYPAWIEGSERQIPYCDDPVDREYLAGKIHGLWLGYGYALRVEGRRQEAVAAYRTALGRRIDWQGIKGILLCALAPGRRRPS